MSRFDYIFKIVLVGDSDVGKSCILLRYVDDQFDQSYVSTIGVDFRYKKLTLGGRPVKLQMWDTAGQERYRTITTAYYRGAQAALMVYDVTSAESFENVASWMSDVRGVSANSIVLLVGNKKDKKGRVVSAEEGAKLALSYGAIFVETSAKTGENIDGVFDELATLMMEKAIERERATMPPVVENVSVLPRKPTRCCWSLLS